MICSNCDTETIHTRSYYDPATKTVVTGCSNCDESVSEVGSYGGFNTAALEQSKRHEVDFIQPDRIDKLTKKRVINEEFVKHYPDKTRHYWRPDEMRKQGYGKLADKTEKLEKEIKQDKESQAKKPKIER